MSSITEQIWRLLKAGVKLEWNESEEAAFSKYLAFFNRAWDTEVHTDASPFGLSGVLLRIKATD